MAEPIQPKAPDRYFKPGVPWHYEGRRVVQHPIPHDDRRRQRQHPPHDAGKHHG